MRLAGDKDKKQKKQRNCERSLNSHRNSKNFNIQGRTTEINREQNSDSHRRSTTLTQKAEFQKNEIANGQTDTYLQI
jgi:hypothetical protein